MRKKKDYIAPMTEVIKVHNEGHLLDETNLNTGNGKVPIGEGDPPSGVTGAKPHYNIWDDDEE